MNGKLKILITELGLSYKKEMWKYIIFLTAISSTAIPLYLWRHQLFMMAYPLMVAVAFSILYWRRYEGIKKRKWERIEKEFIQAFTYFSVFLNDGINVYHSLEMTSEFCSPDLKERLESLLNDIDDDKSVTPFVNFAKDFPNITIREVMISLYEMVEKGENGVYLTQFKSLFSKLSSSFQELGKKKRMEKLQTLTMLPLVGSAMVMIVLIIALLEILGGYVYGI